MKRINMARKPGKKHPVGCTGEDKIWKRNIRKGSRESKTGTVWELSLEARFGNIVYEYQ